MSLRAFAGWVLVLAAATAAIPAALAQQRLPPLRILVGFGAGGSTDVMARSMAVPLAAALDRPVVVVNRPGAGGRVAAVELKEAPADGSVIMFAPMVVPVLAPLVDRKPQYDPVHDFAPVSRIATFRFALAVSAEHPAHNVDELVAWTRADPSRAFFATLATGGLSHLMGLQFARTIGVPMTHVAYPGVGPLVVDVKSQRVPMTFDALSNYIEFHRAGSLRILAVSGAERAPQLPGVPTFAEQGLAVVDTSSWFGVFAPAKTPRTLVDPLSAALARALQDATVRETFSRLGIDPAGTTPDELAATMVRETARWTPVIKAAGLSAE